MANPTPPQLKGSVRKREIRMERDGINQLQLKKSYLNEFYNNM
jgi:hypothetical protein